MVYESTLLLDPSGLLSRTQINVRPDALLSAPQEDHSTEIIEETSYM
jgi:hypothetical protein